MGKNQRQGRDSVPYIYIYIFPPNEIDLKKLNMRSVVDWSYMVLGFATQVLRQVEDDTSWVDEDFLELLTSHQSRDNAKA